MSFFQSENYDAIKAAVLQACELVPEAYRQCFRGLCKTEVRHL